MALSFTPNGRGGNRLITVVQGPTGDTGETGATGATGAGYTATSVTSNSIASSGSKSFTTQSGLAYTVGARVRATDAANTANWMEGLVTAYSSTTLTFTADLSSGSGTISSWNINLAGERGATGETGATGDTGPSGEMGGPGVSVDGEIALFDGVTGTELKRATSTGLLKASSGVLATAVAGTDYVVPDAELTALAGLTSAANKVPYFTGAGTADVADFSSYGRSIVAVADESALKTLVNLEIGTDVQAYDADTAKLDAAQSWTAKQTFTITTKLQQALEKVTITADNPASGDNNFDVLTQAIQYYTTANDTNWTLNVRGDGSNSLDSIMATGESLTIALIVTNTGTAYYQSGFKIDGSSVTPQWLGAAAPTAGTINKRDTYTFTIIKTGSATFIVQASFASGN